MKKIISAIILVIFSFCIISCNIKSSNYLNLSTKPSTHYYSDNLLKEVLSNKKFKLYVFDTNLYKEILVDENESEIIENFLTCLTADDYTDNLPENKEIYRIKIIFDDNTKYIINVYNESVISLSPWDGSYAEDIISMDKIHLRYNLLDFCNHIHNKPISK